MSGMAAEMAARMAADGASGEQGAAVATGAVPGTDAAGTTTTPPAGALNTETSGGSPGPVPYSRFKEVNDELGALKGYSELRDYGYDPGSLKELAAFDAAYRTDPVGTAYALVNNLDLPDEAKERIRSELGVGTDGRAAVTPAGDTAQATAVQSAQGSTDEPPAWAKPLIDDYAARQAKEVEEGQQATLNAMTSRWGELDKGENIETSESTRLKFIRAELASGQPYETVEALVDAARRSFMEEREALAGVVVPRRVGASPASVSGSTLPATPPVKHNSLAEVNRSLRAALEAGQPI